MSEVNEQPKDKVEEAKETLAQITEQNKKLEENIQKLEKLKIDEMLSGQSSAGQEVKPKTKEDLVNEEANKYIRSMKDD